MNRKYKSGELEAKKILESFDIRFAEDYYDDNSCDSMPDLQYEDGRYLEVTHTRHNNAIARTVTKFARKPIAEQLELLEKEAETYERISKLDYPKDDMGEYLPEAIELYQKDFIFHQKMYGTSEDSEFHCDVRTIRMSADNILREITDDKGKKHPNGNVDLFIFALDGEFESVLEFLKTYKWNGAAQQFLNTLLKSPFPTIYLRLWDFTRQSYEVENPLLLRFKKTEDGVLSWELMAGNIKEFLKEE